jgi:hypothetical protein
MGEAERPSKYASHFAGTSSQLWREFGVRLINLRELIMVQLIDRMEVADVLCNRYVMK